MSCADKTLIVNLDSDQIVIQYNDETLTIQEFQNQFEVVGINRYSMRRKQLPSANLAALNYNLESKIANVSTWPLPYLVQYKVNRARIKTSLTLFNKSEVCLSDTLQIYLKIMKSLSKILT
jgi:hypothetical protein